MYLYDFGKFLSTGMSVYKIAIISKQFYYFCAFNLQESW
jgi:hypothetical protein